MIIKTRGIISRRHGDMQNMMNVTLMMIILAFFIVLNSMAVPNDDNRKAAMGSLVGALGILTGGVSPAEFKGKSFIVKPRPAIEERIVVSSRLAVFEKYVVAKNIADKVSTIITKSGVEVTIENGLLFEPQSASFSMNGLEVVDKINEFIKAAKGSLVVEGHTDDKKVVSALYSTPLGLSIARAGVVGRTLIKKGGIKRTNLAISGYGAIRPMYPNDTPEHKRKNDRIRIIYKYAI